MLLYFRSRGLSGVNREAHLLQAVKVSQTFKQESEWWRHNKLSLLKPSCRETMGSHIDKYLLPKFGELSIDVVDERQVQEFVADLNRTNLALKSIRNIIGVLKLILGKNRWRDWSLVLPEVPEREQRSSPRMRCGKSSIPSMGTGAFYLPRWPEQVLDVARYLGCTLRTWTCHPAASLFVAAFGGGRNSRSRLRAETEP